MKKLYRIEQGKVIAGVCGGIGEYANIDPNIIRLITVLLGIFSAGIGILIVYIVMACILPTKSNTF